MSLLIASPLAAQAKNNFPDRRPIVLPTAPMVELSDFRFLNAFGSGGVRFREELKWTNVGTQPIVAFRIIILKYNAFGEPLVGTRWDVEGRNSADWTPLAPGESHKDATSSLGSESVHTAIAYVQKVQLANGTTWVVADSDLTAGLRRVAPHIREFGPTTPTPPGAPQ